MKKISIFLLMFLVLVSVALACPTMNAQTIDELYDEIPSIDADLQVCPIELPENLQLLMSNGNLGINVLKNDNSTVDYTIVLFDGSIVNMYQGTSGSRISVTILEDDLNTIITTPDYERGSVVFSLYQEKKITTNSESVVMKGKLGLTRFAVNLFGNRIAKSLGFQ